MDDATQKLVDEAREYASTGPVTTEVARDYITRLTAALEAAQRPPVSPEVREALEWAGIKALVESAEVPTGVRAVLLGEVFTIREAVDAEIVVRVVLDAALARFSVPSQPVYDEEAIARWLYETTYSISADVEWEDQDDEYRGVIREAAAALVAALRGGELTREETNRG